MGTKVTLEAADGFRLGAYRADPAGPARGGVVVIQEIFGVNHHIRAVCDRLADAGYRAIAPQLFDRIEPKFESGYTAPEVTYARELAGKADWAKMVLDTSAAIEALKHDGPVAVMGFCMGGSVAFLAATRFGGLAAAICYYGGQIARNADKKPKCAVQMHFGEDDDHISMDDVETIRQKRPECEIHIYPGAGHAFGNDERSNYELRSAKIAWQRSLALLSRVFASAKSKQLAAVAAASRTEVTPSAPSEAVKPGIKKPEIKKPKVKKPETVEAQKPEAAQVKKPEAAKPAVKKPAAKKPDAKQPDAAAKPAKPTVQVKPAPVKKPPVEAAKPGTNKAKPAKKKKPRKTPAKKIAPKSTKVEPKRKRKIRPAAKAVKKTKARRKPTPRPKIKARPKTKIRRKAKAKPIVRRKVSVRPKRKMRPKPKPAPRPKRRVPKRKPAPKIIRRKPRPKSEPKPKPKLKPKSKPRPKPKPEPKPEKRRSLWGFGLFSSPYYRRGRF